MITARRLLGLFGPKEMFTGMLLAEAKTSDRVVLIEDTRELQCRAHVPALPKNFIRCHTRLRL
jgi:Flp pilus assembly CpaF family ATPase